MRTCLHPGRSLSRVDLRCSWYPELASAMLVEKWDSSSDQERMLYLGRGSRLSHISKQQLRPDPFGKRPSNGREKPPDLHGLARRAELTLAEYAATPSVQTQSASLVSLHSDEALFLLWPSDQ